MRLKVGEGITDLLAFSVIRPDEVAEARRVFELSIVPLICQRADEQDIVDLLELCDSAATTLRSGDTCAISACSNFHIRMARAAHNAAIEMLARSLDGQLLMALCGAQELAVDADQVISREHRDFVLALQRRNCEAARAIISNHPAGS